MADEKTVETDYKLKYTGEEVDRLLETAKTLKSVYDKMKRVQAGCETISSTSAGTDIIKVIDFSIKFNDIPNVVLIPTYLDNKTSKVKILNITSSNFKVQVVGNDNDVTTNLYWIATEK